MANLMTTEEKQEMGSRHRKDNFSVEANRIIDKQRAEIDRLKALINTPHYTDFTEAVKIEAAHQRERWGEKHDAEKHFYDWLAVFNRLIGKQVEAHWNNEPKKLEHHMITLCAALMNCHRKLFDKGI